MVSMLAVDNYQMMENADEITAKLKNVIKKTSNNNNNNNNNH
tara:strand:+ start:104905 stop:105030 length:126 start_codon:yes stop_codon:yes gene_type:complete